MTENPYKSLRVDPDSGPTLLYFRFSLQGRLSGKLRGSESPLTAIPVKLHGDELAALIAARAAGLREAERSAGAGRAQASVFKLPFERVRLSQCRARYKVQGARRKRARGEGESKEEKTKRLQASRGRRPPRRRRGSAPQTRRSAPSPPRRRLRRRARPQAPPPVLRYPMQRYYGRSRCYAAAVAPREGARCLDPTHLRGAIGSGAGLMPPAVCSCEV